MEHEIQQIRSQTPETDRHWGKFTLRSDWLEFARKLERERDAARIELFAAECELARWLEWARMHGHLEHAGGIVDATREILSEND